MMRALANPVWLALALVAALVFTMVGGVPAVAYDAENHVGDLSDTGVTNPATGDFDMDGNAILACGYSQSDAADPADAGVIRLGNAEEIRWESAPASANEGRFYVSSSETLNYRNGSSSGGFVIDAGGSFGWNTRSLVNSPADGQICGKNQAVSSGACFDFDDTDGNVTVKDKAGTGAGTVTSTSFLTATANPASAGVVRSANTEALSWRNAANDGDETLVVNASDAFVFSGPIVVPTFTKSVTVSAGASGLGPTAPTWAVQDTLAGLQFDAAGEQGGWAVEIDDCWDGVSDMEWKLYLTTETGDVIANTEVIEFDCTYRALADGEASDNGTAVTVSPSYTQSGAGSDSSRHKLEVLLDFDGANQPLTAGDVLHMICNRDVGASDTYSGAVILEQAELEFQCTTIPNH